jgi:hypothetical protein
MAPEKISLVQERSKTGSILEHRPRPDKFRKSGGSNPFIKADQEEAELFTAYGPNIIIIYI